jgi:hypothetical protein
MLSEPIRPTCRALCLLVVIFIGAPDGSAWAATGWFVARTTGSDLNVCNLPNTPCSTINGAIAQAQAGDAIFVNNDIYTGTGPNEIVRVDKTLTLSGGWDPSFTKRVSFTILNGEHQRRGITVDPGADLTISDFFIIWGEGGFRGGGMYVQGGLFAERLCVAQNRATFGGGIAFNAETGNAFALIDTVLIGNYYFADGGGLYVYGFRPDDPNDPDHVNSAVLYNVTLTNNLSVNSVDEEHGTPPTYGGGAFAAHGGHISFLHTTSAENEHWDGRTFTQTGAGIGVDNMSTMSFQNTLVADGCFAPVQWFQFASQGNNVERENNCQFGLPFDRRLVNPLILPPNVNPGPIITITHALKWNSPARDWASPQWCGPTDQRGVTRPQGPACDVGAYERGLDELQGFGSPPRSGAADADRCPAIRWDGKGREVYNPCRVSTDELIRALLTSSLSRERKN